jgi:glycosyltransferase involved in cell wall biosynthesis
MIARNSESEAKDVIEKRSEGEFHSPDEPPEVSVVIPCLNEAETFANCLEKAEKAFLSHKIHDEIIVADNGSTDGFPKIAMQVGARVIRVEPKGYGNALMCGVSQAKANFIIMGDADESYDFEEIPLFVDQLRKGYDLVQRCRLPSGGGRGLPGAMPFLHRWLGNPLFSALARRWFKASIRDIYCGMRAFTKTLYDRLNLRCTGMEFATDMIIKTSLYHRGITEVPITLHLDAHKSHPPQLKTFHDGWRTLRLFLISGLRYMFLISAPCSFFLRSPDTYSQCLPSKFCATFATHVYPIASMVFLLGFQSIFSAIPIRVFAINEGFLTIYSRINRLFIFVNLKMALSNLDSLSVKIMIRHRTRISL